MNKYLWGFFYVSSDGILIRNFKKNRTLDQVYFENTQQSINLANQRKTKK